MDYVHFGASACGSLAGIAVHQLRHFTTEDGKPIPFLEMTIRRAVTVKARM
jgi:hypothetical protein